MSGATILHADADAFYASVEQRDDPRLRGRPVIVGGGVVLAASYEARAFGVRGAMGATQARRLCPQAIVVTPRWEAYAEAGRALRAIFRRMSPVVETVSAEEAFIDARGLEAIGGTPPQIATTIRCLARERVGLAVSVGVASTRLLAKTASREAKPDGLLIVEPEDELAFLHALPAARIWGVGPATAARLRAHGLVTMADVAARPEQELMAVAGRAAGRRLHAIAHNHDPRPVRAGRRRRSVGAQSALGFRPRSPAALDAVLVGLVDRVTRRLRAAGLTGRTVTLRLRFGDYSRATRARTLREPTAQTRPVLACLRALLEAARATVLRRGVTLLGVTVSGLVSDTAPRQLALPVDGPDLRAVDAAVDAVRERFGTRAITRATLLGQRDPGGPADVLSG